MPTNVQPQALTSAPTTLTPEERAVIDAIRETQFGAVEVVLHQARIVQVVRTERQRFDMTQAKS